MIDMRLWISEESPAGRRVLKLRYEHGDGTNSDTSSAIFRLLPEPAASIVYRELAEPFSIEHLYRLACSRGIDNTVRRHIYAHGGLAGCIADAIAASYEPSKNNGSSTIHASLKIGYKRLLDIATVLAGVHE